MMLHDIVQEPCNRLWRHIDQRASERFWHHAHEHVRDPVETQVISKIWMHVQDQILRDLDR